MKRASQRRLWLVILAVLGVSAAVVSTAVQVQSVWTGVYTKAQAKVGESVYNEQCASCHGEDLEGREAAPALAGSTFGETWKGATLRKMFERIESMPPTRPKSLTGQQYADVLAYMLSASEIPAGSTLLEADRPALAQMIFSRTRPQP